FQAAGVDADAHRQPLRLGLADDLAVAVVAADVAGVDADLVNRVVQRGQGHLVVEMDVADQRDADAALDLAQDGGVLRLWHGDAADLRAGLLQAVDLVHRRLDVAGVRRRHRLHPDRVAAADNLVADAHLARLVPLGLMLVGHWLPRKGPWRHAPKVGRSAHPCLPRTVPYDKL